MDAGLFLILKFPCQLRLLWTRAAGYIHSVRQQFVRNTSSYKLFILHVGILSDWNQRVTAIGLTPIALAICILVIPSRYNQMSRRSCRVNSDCVKFIIILTC